MIVPVPRASCLVPQALAITQLSLSAFRNYADARLVLDPVPVVLTGPNGSGKTNLLEALSLLLPGRGLRRAPFADLQNRNLIAPWAVAADLLMAGGSTGRGAIPLPSQEGLGEGERHQAESHFNEETPPSLSPPSLTLPARGREFLRAGPQKQFINSLRIGTGRDPEAPEKERRVVHIGGKTAKSQQALAEHVNMAWITPDMDRLLAEGPAARRRLLDRLAYSFDSAHAGRVHRYEKAMRERLHLLGEGAAAPAWLDALEDIMAQTGTAIAAARAHLLGQLQEAMEETSGAFPQADITLKGLAEESLCDLPALLVEDKLRRALAASRRIDAENGTTAAGPHRGDLAVVHRARQCPADLCSTGEQKALLIAIMLAYVRVLGRARGVMPLLLLDDITAHLDDRRRAALFEEILALGVQAWLTGTDSESFRLFLDEARHFRVEKGNVAPAK